MIKPPSDDVICGWSHSGVKLTAQEVGAESPLKEEGDSVIIKNAVKNTYRLWPEQEIPYVISNSFGTQERSVIRAAMEQFSRQGPILSNWFWNRSSDKF